MLAYELEEAIFDCPNHEKGESDWAQTHTKERQTDGLITWLCVSPAKTVKFLIGSTAKNRRLNNGQIK